MTRHSLLAVLTLLGLASTDALRAEPSSFEWIASGGGAKSDKSRAVAFAPDGGAYLAGETTDEGDFGGVKREGLGGTDFFLAKIAKGGKTLWVRSLGGSLVDRGYGVVSDGEGNAYVTGHYQSTDAKGGSGEILPNRGDYDVFVAKYSPAGDLLWIRTAGGSGYDYGHGIALDPAGDVVVSGAVAGEAHFGDQVTKSTGKGRAVFCAKYSPAGELRWVTTTTGNFSGSGHGIAADADGNLYIGGSGSGSGEIGGVALSAKSGSALVMKLDSGGKALWAKLTPGTPSAGFHEITVDEKGRVWGAGMFKGKVTFGGQTWETTGAKDSDGILAHYSTEGELLWSHSIQGPGTDYCLGVATDGSGRVFVTGEYSREASFAGKKLTSEGATDIYVAALDEKGGLEWCVRAGGAKGDNAYTMTWHPEGKLLFGGSCTAPIAFGAKTLASGAAAEAYGAVLVLP